MFFSSLFDQKHSVFHDISGRMTNTIVTTPVNVTGAPVTNIVANHAEKPRNLRGGSAPELVKKETDTRVRCTVDALKHSETLCAITMRYMLRMERLNLGNSPTANIKGKGDVIHIWKRVANNEYFIIFADDCTKYCYVYLLKSKDEAIDKFVLYKTEVENQPFVKNQV
ncbi:hypothetical protein Tco_0657968 [Tanacetum coccineum]